MAKRTFGWVQNPGKLSNLKIVVSLFEKDSKYNTWIRDNRLPFLKKNSLISDENYISFMNELSNDEISIQYVLLKGQGAGNAGRANAICSGIVQAAIDGQQPRTFIDDEGKEFTIKKPYTDNWSAEGFLRWAISCGFLNYDRNTDTCSISDMGRLLANTEDGSNEEKEVFTKALLSYPPVCRILSLLSDGNGYTKFELGRKLGFYGELGFTSIPQNVYVFDYSTASATEKDKVKSNEEGDSDKYARGIASWCTQMGWVESKNEKVTETYRGKDYTVRLQKYYITRCGEKALKRSVGNSSNAKIPKIVLFEMLASNKAVDAEYLRNERANIIKAITTGEKSLRQIQDVLKAERLDVTEASIADDILGLTQIGLNIRERNGKYKITDRITGLIIPSSSSVSKADITQLKETVRDHLKSVDHKYLVLIDLAYSDASSKGKKNADAREFEIQTAELFTKELSFNGMRLGDSNRPDVIISHDNYGTIIDNKSYKDGFNIDRKCADEMSRYINENARRIPGLPKNEWWKNFDAKVDTFTFLFVTSFLKGNYEAQLEYISKSQNNIPGGAIAVDNLLYLAERLKSGNIRNVDFYNMFENHEIKAYK